MSSDKVTYALVGLFVAVLGTALIAGVLWLGAGGPRPDYKVYQTYIPESVYGLSKDAAVTYRGVEVGRVTSIELDRENPQRVTLLLNIRRGTPIKVDTVATLEVQAITGLAHVDLSGGSPGAEMLKAAEGQAYPVIDSKPSVLGTLDQTLGRLVEEFTETSERVNQMLSDENQRHLTRTLERTEQLVASLLARSEQLSQVLEGLGGIAEGARETSARLPALVARLEKSAGALERMADDLGSAGSAVGNAAVGTMERIDRATTALAPEAAAMLSELRQAAENLRRLSEALERDPSIVVYGARPPRPGPGE
jgi:phospholipid/cholesterol/gamma-HCH transport system substrate-binding protein